MPTSPFNWDFSQLNTQEVTPGKAAAVQARRDTGLMQGTSDLVLILLKSSPLLPLLVNKTLTKLTQSDLRVEPCLCLQLVCEKQLTTVLTSNFLCTQPKSAADGFVTAR